MAMAVFRLPETPSLGPGRHSGFLGGCADGRRRDDANVGVRIGCCALAGGSAHVRGAFPAAMLVAASRHLLVELRGVALGAAAR